MAFSCDVVGCWGLWVVRPHVERTLVPSSQLKLILQDSIAYEFCAPNCYAIVSALSGHDSVSARLDRSGYLFVHVRLSFCGRGVGKNETGAWQQEQRSQVAVRGSFGLRAKSDKRLRKETLNDATHAFPFPSLSCVYRNMHVVITK